MRRLAIILSAGVILSGIAVWWNSGSARSHPVRGQEDRRPQPEPKTHSAEDAGPTSVFTGSQAFYDPLVIAPCNLAPISEQDVSSQVDGVFDAIHVELGQRVEKGTLLGRLDDRQLRAQVEALKIRASSSAAERIAKAQFEEADSKVQYVIKANASGLTTVPELEYKTFLSQRERFAQEITKAREERQSAQRELERAQVVLGLHEIRAALDGEIVKIHKRNGEAVKQAEPLFRIANCKALRVEGLCKVQQANLIHVGMRALVEPELRGEQMTELVGHTGAVTALAIAADGRLIASASEDRSVLLWSWPGGARLGSLPHPAGVTAVVIGPGNAILTGCTDGQVRCWRYDAANNHHAAITFSQAHEGSIRSMALSGDGATCATGGDDNRIGIWDVATGRQRRWLDSDEGVSAHQGAVTSLHFAPDGHLVSSGRDNSVKVWDLSGDGKLVGVHPGRSGDVTHLGISPDGRRILFDMGDELRILDRDRGTRVGSLHNQKQGRFQGFAQFSPSGAFVFTAASNSRLQLWRGPATAEQTQFFRHGYAAGFHRGSLLAVSSLGSDSPLNVVANLVETQRSAAPQLWQLAAHEVRHFVVPGSTTVHCAVFAPDETVVFTGGTDRSVRVWALPPAHLASPLEGRITYVGSQVERGTDMVRVRAELDNPGEPARRLRAGLFAVMRLFPETAPAARISGAGR